MHNIEEIRNELRHHIDVLTKRYGFAECFEASDGENNFWDNYWKWQRTLPQNSGYEFYTGCTRIVMHPEESNYVFKWQPANETCDYDNEPLDYCAQECEAYQLAEQEGVSDYFAWTAPVLTTEIAGRTVTFYAMEWLGDNSAFDSVVDDIYQDEFERYCASEGCDMSDEDEVEECRDSFELCDDYEMEYVVDRIRDTDGVNLYAFLDSNNIGDLHFGNWRVRDNGTIVAIDYASYNQRTCSGYKKNIA